MSFDEWYELNKEALTTCGKEEMLRRAWNASVRIKDEIHAQLDMEETTETVFTFISDRLGIVRGMKSKTSEAMAIWVVKKDGEYSTLTTKAPNYSRAMIKLFKCIGEFAEEDEKLRDISIVPIGEATSFIESSMKK